jgi:hypothetical protein
LNGQEAQTDGAAASGKRARLAGILFLLLVVAFSSGAKIRTTLADPNFPTVDPTGTIRADPGLLFYMLGRIVDNGGLPPGDFRADPRVAWPIKTDLPALDSVSQEFPIAWAYLLTGKPLPLHVFCLVAMSIFSSLAAVGVWWLALELTGKYRWACVAAALYALIFANYRTMGFLMMREDFALPFFALHLALALRASRVRTTFSMVACAVPLAIALASWHAMVFVVTLETLVLFAWFLRTGDNPFSVPGAWIVPAIVAALSVGVPILWRTGFLLSPPVRIAAGLLVAAFHARRGAGRAACAFAAIGAVVAISLAHRLAGSGAADYVHVWALMSAKIRFLGVLPADPTLLSPDARVMWHGPFATFPPTQWNSQLGVAVWLALPFLAKEVFGWYTGRGDAGRCLLAAFSAVALANSFLVVRVVAVSGILLPVCAAVLLDGVRRSHAAVAAALLAIGWQGTSFGKNVYLSRNSWYGYPVHLAESRALLEALPSLVPDNEAVTADSVISTAILAHTAHPVVLQPKWEQPDALRRIQEYLRVFYHGTPDELRRWSLSYGSRYLLIDRWMMAKAFLYLGGIPADRKFLDPGTAAERFLSADESIRDPVPGYRLLYSSPAWLVGPDGLPSDQMRLYELSALPGEPPVPVRR